MKTKLKINKNIIRIIDDKKHYRAEFTDEAGTHSVYVESEE